MIVIFVCYAFFILLNIFVWTLHINFWWLPNFICILYFFIFIPKQIVQIILLFLRHSFNLKRLNFDCNYHRDNFAILRLNGRQDGIERIINLFYNTLSTKWCIIWLPLLNLISVIEHDTYVYTSCPDIREIHREIEISDPQWEMTEKSPLVLKKKKVNHLGLLKDSPYSIS